MGIFAGITPNADSCVVGDEGLKNYIFLRLSLKCLTMAGYSTPQVRTKDAWVTHIENHTVTVEQLKCLLLHYITLHRNYLKSPMVKNC